ncbi:MAG: FecR domain-containing protein [Massilia sp.]
MKNQRQKHTVINGLLFAALLLVGSLAWAAQVAGTVVHLSGPLLAQKSDGTVKVLALKSEVESGDTLVSEKNTYAQIKFIDNSEITLKPGTTFRIENFAFEAGKPDADSAAFSLVKGGLRSITGLLGKRNKEKFALKTPTATIGIRGTTFIAQYVAPLDAAIPLAQGKSPAAPSGPQLPPGLHVQVTDGMIVVTNNGGSLGFQAGQFGYVPGPAQPPVIVPPNPGLQFVPPPSFNSGTTTGPVASSRTQDQNAVDCIVR